MADDRVPRETPMTTASLVLLVGDDDTSRMYAHELRRDGLDVLVDTN
jgi:hypothetical protein